MFVPILAGFAPTVGHLPITGLAGLARLCRSGENGSGGGCYAEPVRTRIQVIDHDFNPNWRWSDEPIVIHPRIR